MKTLITKGHKQVSDKRPDGRHILTAITRPTKEYELRA